MEVNQLMFTVLVMFAGIGLWTSLQLSGVTNMVVKYEDYELPKLKK